ncbi:MAG: tagaturonate reductase [Synergistaceae bacterium]|nr:tagaturonate reductase [Synergistaceae bacterium]
MRVINETIVKTERPVKIMQFGEGNFLRAFVDYMVDIANEKEIFDCGVVIVKPIALGSVSALNAQDCVYTVILRGKQAGETFSQNRVVTSVVKAFDSYSQYDEYAALAKLPDLRFIVSNTTEAGIVYDESDDYLLTPPGSYPGKLTKFLYERYQSFKGARDKGLIMLPVELIEMNGAKLRECCVKLTERWGLPGGFREWLLECNIFCSTLVDRIVTGYPKDEASHIEAELGYKDALIVTGEPFALWVIECEKPDLVQKEFPLDKAGLPVIFTDNMKPYRERKVRILNGAHTSTVLAAYLAGLDTVGELMSDKTMRKLIKRNIYVELAPNVPLPEDEVKAFADSVMERFENPFIKHSLLSISLNSISKFKARVLPSIKDTFKRTGRLPDSLCFSLAALMAFYSGDVNNDGKLMALRDNDTYEIMDDAPVIRFFADNHVLPADEFAGALLKREDFWGENLINVLPGIADKVGGYLQSIRDNGIRAAIAELLEQKVI